MLATKDRTLRVLRSRGGQWPASILIVSDLELVRVGLRSLLVGAGARSVYEAEIASLHSSPAFEPGTVVLLDLDRPEADVALLEALRAHHPEALPIALSGSCAGDLPARLLVGGARGYLTKDSPAEQLLLAVRLVAAGGMAFGSTVVAAIEAELVELALLGAQRLRSRYGLSEREFEVLALLESEVEVSAIAQELALSKKTVQNIVCSLSRKLGVSGRSEVAAAARALDPAALRQA